MEIGIGLGAVAFALLAGAAALVYSRRRTYKPLLDAEVKEFLYGRSENAAAQYQSEGYVVPATALMSPYDKSFEIPKSKLDIGTYSPIELCSRKLSTILEACKLLSELSIE